MFELPPDEDFANDMVSIGGFDDSSDGTDVMYSTHGSLLSIPDEGNIGTETTFFNPNKMIDTVR